MPPRNFKTPDDLYKAFTEYKDSLKKESTKWGKVQYVGKDGERVEDYPMMPYSLSGFYVYCYDIYGVAEQYFVNKDSLYMEYVSICSRIKQEIRTNQITGGLLGFFNPSITQRLNNLKETTEVTTVEKPKPMFGNNPLENN